MFSAFSKWWCTLLHLWVDASGLHLTPQIWPVCWWSCSFQSLTVCLWQVIKSASETETEEGTQSVVSVKVASNITAYCNASNEHGTDVVTFNIKVNTSEFLLLSCLNSLFLYLCMSLSSCPCPPCLCLKALISVYRVACHSARLTVCCCFKWYTVKLCGC